MKYGILSVSVGIEMGLVLHHWRLRLIIVVMACLGLSGLALGQTVAAPTELRIVTRVVQPFVMKDGNSYKGFSVELWQAIAKQMNVTFRWVEVPTVKDILTTMADGKGDVAMAAISVTSQREQEFDFSQPMFDSGLQIMVRNDDQSGFGFMQIWTLLTGGAMPFLLSLLAALIIVPAHLAWFAERKHHSRLFSESYIPGIFNAMWWATGAAAGQQPDHPRSTWGRILSSLLILISVVFMAYFTAAITSALTVQTLRGDINSPQDLVGRKVGTTIGSTASIYLKGIDVAAVEFEKIEHAFVALNNKQLDAVVFDSPVLLYYAATAGRHTVRIVGPMLRKENYGILFPRGSALRKPVNEALLTLRESGIYDAIYAKWFSVTQSAAARP
jgi:polar amino acid transport system substrate-binding protein